MGSKARSGEVRARMCVSLPTRPAQPAGLAGQTRSRGRQLECLAAALIDRVYAPLRARSSRPRGGDLEGDLAQPWSGETKLDDLAFVNPPLNSEGSRTQVANGDILIVITGAGVTNPALLDRDLGEAYVSQHVGLVRPTDKELSEWLLCLMSPTGGRAELVERAYGAGKPGLNLDNIRSLSIPLPPLAEQHRIVAKVGELMKLCDRLETSLTDTATTRRRLLEAILHAALAPREESVIDAVA
jgi:hypothetical protein